MTGVGKLLTQQEVADVLRRNVKSVQRLRAKGELGYLPGRPVMIPQAELDAYLERRMVRRQVVETLPEAATLPQAPMASAGSSSRACRTPQEQADYMLAKMKRDGSLDGFIRLQREVAEQQQKSVRLSEKATSRRQSHELKSSAKSD